MSRKGTQLRYPEPYLHGPQVLGNLGAGRAPGHRYQFACGVVLPAREGRGEHLLFTHPAGINSSAARRCARGAARF